MDPLDVPRPAPPGRRRSPRLRRTWGQRLVLLALPVAAVAALASATVLVDLARLADEIERVALATTLHGGRSAGEVPTPGQPQVFLVVGADGTGGTRDDDGGGPRTVLSDSIALLRTDPARASAELLPLPRDLIVDIPGHGSSKINAARSLGARNDPVAGGPALLIETIRANLGIDVDHYLEIDFAGFAQVVDRFGGIAVWFPTPTRDRHVGIDVAAPGCVRLDGAHALDLARSRYYDALVDDEWTRDPSSDLGRIRRQQVILRAVLSRALDQGIRDPFTLRRVVHDLAGSVALDDTLSLDDVFSLGHQYRGVHLDDIVTRDLDVSFTARGAVSLDDSPANQLLLAHFATRTTQPPTGPAPPSTAGQGSSSAPAPTSTVGPPVGATSSTAGPSIPAVDPFTPTLRTPDGHRCPS